MKTTADLWVRIRKLEAEREELRLGLNDIMASIEAQATQKEKVEKTDTTAIMLETLETVKRIRGMLS